MQNCKNPKEQLFGCFGLRLSLVKRNSQNHEEGGPFLTTRRYFHPFGITKLIPWQCSINMLKGSILWGSWDERSFKINYKFKYTQWSSSVHVLSVRKNIYCFILITYKY